MRREDAPRRRERAEFLNPAERHGFVLEQEREVWMGEKKLLFLKFKKG